MHKETTTNIYYTDLTYIYDVTETSTRYICALFLLLLIYMRNKYIECSANYAKC